MKFNMDKSKEYIRNTIILLIGKFATQFISFFLLPLYTRYLLTDDFGLVDLYQTYISLFVPVLLLCLDSAVFRFLIDERNNEKEISKIITNVCIKTLKQILLFVIIAITICLALDIKYKYFVVINIASLMMSNVMLQISRGVGQNIKYSVACIITGAITLITNFVLIVICKFGANSILIASSVGNIVCSIFIILSTKIYKYFKMEYRNNEKIKKMLAYSIPLIPNALSWWIVNASDRTIISIFINTAANGIYTVSGKFSNIVNSVFSVFSMSWQETASIHINDPDRDVFFSKMINWIYNLFVCVSVAIIVILRFGFDVIIGEDYFESYNYIPILLFANTFSILIGLFGGIYIAQKKTKQVTITTLVSAFLNIMINLLLVRAWGLYAACMSTLLSYVIMALYRYIDIRKFIKIKIYKETIIGACMMFVLSFGAYYSKNIILGILTFIIILLYTIYINRNILKDILKRINFHNLHSRN